MSTTTYLILFATNLTFIVTHLYGWLLKRFYRPKAYGEHFHELFPAQRIVATTYLLQIFELPYLLQIGDPDALLYVNAFSLLFLSLQLLVMCEVYFFPKNKHNRQYPLIYVPAMLVLLPMFLQAVHLISLPEGWRTWAIVAVSILFAFYFGFNIHMVVRIERAVRRANGLFRSAAQRYEDLLTGAHFWMPESATADGTSVNSLILQYYCSDAKFQHNPKGDRKGVRCIRKVAP